MPVAGRCTFGGEDSWRLATDRPASRLGLGLQDRANVCERLEGTVKA